MLVFESVFGVYYNENVCTVIDTAKIQIINSFFLLKLLGNV